MKKIILLSVLVLAGCSNKPTDTVKAYDIAKFHQIYHDCMQPSTNPDFVYSQQVLDTLHDFCESAAIQHSTFVTTYGELQQHQGDWQYTY